MKRPELGQWLTINGEVRKVRIGKPDSYPVQTRWEHHGSLQPRQVMFIGWRTVTEGITRLEYSGDDQTYPYVEFEPERYLEVWMVVESARHNPIHVLPTDAINFEAHQREEAKS